MGREFSTPHPRSSSAPVCTSLFLWCSGSRHARINSYLLCFLGLRLLRNPCVHDRNALNSFRSKHLRTTFFATEGWGMISAPVASPEGFATVYSFQQLTTIKFCNSSVLITIQNARGGYPLPVLNLKFYFNPQSSRSLPPSPRSSRDASAERGCGNSSFLQLTASGQRLTCSSFISLSAVTFHEPPLPLPHLSHSITTGRVPDACLRSIGENLE